MPKKEKSASPKLGAQYQATKLIVQIGTPPTLNAIQHKGVSDVPNVFRSGNYQKGVVVALADQWGSKKLGHAAALTRLSVTALAPEVYATAGSAIQEDLDVANTIVEHNARTTGFDYRGNSFGVDKARTYFLMKYLLGAGRKVVNKTRIAEPVKRALSMIGGTL